MNLSYQKYLFLLRAVGISLLFMFLFTSCAVQRAPGGGPQDKTPPEFISSNIFDGSIELALDQELIFYFSEALDEVSIKRGVTLFPLNVTDINVRYKHKRILIRPVKKWQTDQAYSLVIDNAVSDLRKNPLNGSISFSFSTGSHIPQGKIAGKVYGLGKNESATLLLGEALPIDSLFTSYQYFAQSNDEGFFELNYLPERSFRLMGYLDRDRSRSYDPFRDDLVLPLNLDVVAKKDSLVYIQELKLVRGHFKNPLLLSAKMIYPGKMTLKYSKYPDPEQDFSYFSLDSTEIDSIIVENEFVHIYHFPTFHDSLILTIPSLSDTLNCLSADSIVTIKRVEYPDTSYSVAWKKSSLIIEPDIFLDSLPALFESKDDTITFKFIRKKAGYYEPLLISPFSGLARFVLPESEFYPDLKDSIEYKVRIEKKEKEGFGSLSFSFPSPATTLMLLKSRGISYIQKAGKNGEYLFNEVSAGTYSLYRFDDTNENGKADNGVLYPYTPPEIIKFMMNKIDIRKNWETSLSEEQFSENNANIMSFNIEEIYEK